MALVELSSQVQDTNKPVAVSVPVVPWQSDAGPVMLTLGLVLIVTVAVAVLVQPFEAVPVTV